MLVFRSKMFEFQEEEDDLTDSETDESDFEKQKSKIKWKQTMVKDLATLATRNEMLKRRHSISISTTKEEISTSCSSDKEILHEANFVTIDESTLNLSLSEVGHIRSVLAKAELEVTNNSWLIYSHGWLSRPFLWMTL